MRQTDMISHYKFESWYRGDYHVIRSGTYRTRDTKCWAFYREKKKTVETTSVLGLDYCIKGWDFVIKTIGVR